MSTESTVTKLPGKKRKYTKRKSKATYTATRLNSLDSERQTKIEMTKWELQLLMSHEQELRLQGRDLDYDRKERMKQLQLRLDHYLGAPEFQRREKYELIMRDKVTGEEYPPKGDDVADEA